MTALVVAAAIGALGGLAGGAIAAIAAMRSSQIAARAELAKWLAAYDAAAVDLYSAPSEAKAETLERAWHDLSVHQLLLSPSRRIEKVLTLARKVARETGEIENRGQREKVLAFAGALAHTATAMIGAHSYHLFRWRAKRDEVKHVKQLLESPEAKDLDRSIRQMLSGLLPPLRRWRYRRLLKRETDKALPKGPVP